ncbi:hypothetical protein ScPMuIL_015446 [Solemya velum]
MAVLKRYGLLICLLPSLNSVVNAYIEGLYCGQENCYDIIGVGRDAAKSDISSSYRKLAKKWHPDMHKDEEKKEDAVKKFQRIANAYEILKDEEQRNNYDYMLDHPEEYYSHYYYYYRRKMAPQVDVRIVIAVTITVISIIQYFSAWNNYNTAITYFSRDHKYRHRALEIARNEGLLSTGKKRDRRSKEEIKEEEESVVKQIISEKMDIRGSYSKPSYKDVLWIQLVYLPLYLTNLGCWWLRWVWKFNIKREEYGQDEKAYIMRKKMKLGQGQWDAIEEHEKEKFFEKELWKEENYGKWKEVQEEEMKKKMAESSRYKMYRRYMKKGGPGQMTFGPD